MPVQARGKGGFHLFISCRDKRPAFITLSKGVLECQLGSIVGWILGNTYDLGFFGFSWQDRRYSMGRGTAGGILAC